MSNNPLQSYFRRPAIYIKLPSDGKYWPPGSLEVPENGELPVLPMTAIDEITYRTPDALFNGQATVDVVQSCIPAIKNAWDIPAIDLDTILIALRIASYGHQIDIDTTCPSCGEETTFAVDLRNILEGLRPADYTKVKHVSDLTIFFKPLSYKEFNANSMIQFEEQKIIELLQNSDVEEEQKVKTITQAFLKVGQLTVKALSQCIEKIETPETTVNDAKYIFEYLDNCERDVFDSIREHVTTLRETSEMKPLNITCPKCQHKYEQPFTLNMSNFFV